MTDAAADRPTADQAARELRRLRAALGAAAAAAVSRPDVDAAALVTAEAAFLVKVVAAASDEPSTALRELFLRLRSSSLTHAADLPPTADSLEMLRGRLKS